jgi:hypothetical protein
MYRLRRGRTASHLSSVLSASGTRRGGAQPEYCAPLVQPANASDQRRLMAVLVDLERLCGGATLAAESLKGSDDLADVAATLRLSAPLRLANYWAHGRRKLIKSSQRIACPSMRPAHR